MTAGGIEGFNNPQLHHRKPTDHSIGRIQTIDEFHQLFKVGSNTRLFASNAGFKFAGFNVSPSPRTPDRLPMGVVMKFGFVGVIVIVSIDS